MSLDFDERMLPHQELSWYLKLSLCFGSVLLAANVGRSAPQAKTGLVTGGAVSSVGSVSRTNGPIVTAVTGLQISAQEWKRNPPFWRAKTPLFERMKSERHIVVSVLRETSPLSGLTKFEGKGAGFVKVPRERAFQGAQKFPDLKKVSEHFREVEWDPAQGKLFLFMQAMGFQARMMLEIRFASDTDRSEIQWKVISGMFSGMNGVLGFETPTPDQGLTEVSILAHLESADFPIHPLFAGWTLEILTRQIAISMRSYLEAQDKLR